MEMRGVSQRARPKLGHEPETKIPATFRLAPLYHQRSILYRPSLVCHYLFSMGSGERSSRWQCQATFIGVSPSKCIKVDDHSLRFQYLPTYPRRITCQPSAESRKSQFICATVQPWEVSWREKRGTLVTPQTGTIHHRHISAADFQFAGSYIDINANKLLKSSLLPHNDPVPAVPATLGEILLTLSNGMHERWKTGHTDSSIMKNSAYKYSLSHCRNSKTQKSHIRCTHLTISHQVYFLRRVAAWIFGVSHLLRQTGS